MSQISAAPPTNDVDIPSDEEPISGTPPNIDEDIRHTPHNRRIANYHNYSMGAVDISKLRDALETRGQYIGGVDPDVFVKTFMGWNDETSNSFRLKQPSKTKVSCLVGMAGKPESGMNKDWQIALSGWPLVRKRGKLQSLDFEDTHDYRDAESHLGPDSCIYFRARPIVPRHTQRKVDFANVQSFTEHKASEKMDAFVDGGDEEYDGEAYYVMAGYSKRKGGVEEDEKEGEGEEERETGTSEQPYIADSPAAADVDAEGGEADPEVAEDREPTPSEDYPFENDTKQGQSTRGQIASYAGVTMAMQFRTHLFSVLVCGRYARFIRWDRSCAIVTRRFDYTTHPLIIFDFYKRFAQLDDVQPVEMMRKYATSYFTGEHADFYKKESNPKQLPLLSLVFGEDTYVVPAPYFDGTMYSPFGRCTRNRAVVLLKERKNAEEAKDGTYGKHGQILYLKEYWREESIYTKKESEVYRILEGAKVTFIAKMHAGGDLMTGKEANAKAITTIGHEWKSKPWVPNATKLRIRHLTAHFIVLSTLGRDLATFKTARQLVTCIADAMDAHQQVYKLGILHRDISAGNILMTLQPENRRGFLIDWDHCIFLNDALKERVGTRVHRTGTWQFMSAILTQHPNKASHTVVDDRESALHVLTYMALKHLSHNSTDEQALEGKLRMFNDYIARVGKPDIASDYKASIIVQGGPRVKFDIRAITLLIQDLSGFFAPRYIDKYDRTAGELEIMSEAARDRYKTEKDQHQQKLQQLQDPASDFVYKTMRSWAAMMPEPPDNVTQWVDNMQGHDGLLKRPGDHLASAREKMSLRCDGRVSFKSSDTRPTSLD
ncbi:Fungal-type protein kinase domain-containing protein [Pleurotus pulmonarius]